MTKLPIGELLKKYGFINDQHLNIALKIKKFNPNKLLGEILRELSFASTTDIAFALAKQSGKEYLNLNEVIPNTETLKLIPKDTALQFNLLPINHDDKTIDICLPDPYNIVAIDLVKRRTKLEPNIYVGDENLILKAIQTYYSLIENPLEKQFENLLSKSLSEGIGNTAPEFVDFIINSGIINRASDIHITPENLSSNVFYRIDGIMQHFYALPLDFHAYLVSRIKILSNLDIAEQRLPQDGSFTHKFLNEEFDLRVSTVPTAFGENVVLRILSKNISIFNLENLGFENFQINLLKKHFNKSMGILLLTGPTGSGKTTTLYSALRRINILNRNVVTVEDPIEYKFPFIKQTQINERAGYTFSRAVRSFLRQDPDVILIGEIRDLETAEMAVRASMTGHLVLSTLHSNDAVGAIPRLEDIGIKPFLIASSLNAIVSQRLIRKICPSCKVGYKISIENLAKALGLSVETIKKYVKNEEIVITKGKGCSHCNNTGYLGRTILAEILEIDEEISSAIAESKNINYIKKLAIEKGMIPIKEIGLIKILKRITTIEEINRVVG
jgi:type IV pilus assembly protein PilB